MTRRELPSPASTLLQWFDSLPLEAKQDTSYLVLASIRDEAIFDSTDAIVEELRSWILAMQTKSDLRHVGAIVSLRAVIDNTMMRKRGTMADWDKVKAGLQAANALAAQRGQSQSFDQSIQQIDLRARRWIKIVKEWKKLCATKLSDEAFDAWSNSRMPRFGPQ